MLSGIPAAFNSSSAQTNDNEIAARAITAVLQLPIRRPSTTAARMIAMRMAMPRLLVARSMKPAGW
jgi:hypothetical protein